MSDETTRDMSDARSHEERVLAKLEAIDARLSSLESTVERRMYDTQPIWEKALSGIVEANQRLDSLERKVDVLAKDMLTLRADQAGIEARLLKLEGRDEDNLLTIG